MAESLKIKAIIPQAKFLSMKQKFRAFVAGYGCLRENTEIVTADGLVPIGNIDRPMQILSLNEKNNQLELCRGGPSFPKGKANLYRIVTKQGEFVASGSHRLFSAEHKYLSVNDLSVGQGIYTSYGSPLFTNLVQGRLIYQQDASGINIYNRGTPRSTNIIAIEKQKINEYYWDIQIDKNHNYLTADGTVHHNSSKTFTGCMGMCQHYYEHPLINQGYFAPTYSHIRDIFYPTIEEVAEKFNMSVDIKEGNKEVHFYSGGQYRGTTICRSLERPGTIIGFKIGNAMLDELDILPIHKARIAWQKIIARMRYQIEGLRNGIDVTTTPEGFKYIYQLFYKNPLENHALLNNYGLIQASTYDNEKNLPPDYIPSLIEAYPSELIDAYIEGQFVNLTSGTVYRNYDRKKHNSIETIQEKEQLYIGMDFNVMHMAATVYVKRGEAWHAVAELKEIFDTPDMIKIIQDKWQSKHHPITIYPDATGGSRKSVSANSSDLILLRQARFNVKAHGSNPLVKNRILATNKAFKDGKLFVNHSECPIVASCFEQQSYDSNGEPDKNSGFDHQNDASTYPIAYEMPIKSRAQIATSTW